MSSDLYDAIIGLILIIFSILNIRYYKANRNLLKRESPKDEIMRSELKGSRSFAYRELIFFYMGLVGALFFFLKACNII